MECKWIELNGASTGLMGLLFSRRRNQRPQVWCSFNQPRTTRWKPSFTPTPETGRFPNVPSSRVNDDGTRHELGTGYFGARGSQPGEGAWKRGGWAGASLEGSMGMLSSSYMDH